MSILDAIYDAVDDDQAFARLPAALSTEIGSRSCIIQVLAPDGRVLENRFSYWESEQFDYFAANQLYTIDEWRQFGLTRQFVGQAFNYDRHFSTEHFLNSPFYNEFFRKIGDDTARCVGAMMPLRDQTLLVGLHRPARDRPFEERQRARFQGLTHHLRRLAAARAALVRERQTVRELTSALDAPAIGIISVDVLGRLVHANSAGHDILRLGDGLVLVGQTIAAQARAVERRFSEAMSTAASRSGGRGDALLVPRPSGKPPWRVIVVPCEAQASGSATLLIESPGDEGSLKAGLAAFYGLTRAESEVAACLAEGLTPAEIADRRRVSLDTVRNQFKALFQKTGAERLGGLIALLSRTIRTR